MDGVPGAKIGNWFKFGLSIADSPIATVLGSNGGRPSEKYGAPAAPGERQEMIRPSQTATKGTTPYATIGYGLRKVSAPDILPRESGMTTFFAPRAYYSYDTYLPVPINLEKLPPSVGGRWTLGPDQQ